MMTLAISASPTPYTRVQSSATGEFAERVANLVRRAVQPDRTKASDWRPVLHAKIEEIAAECSTSDWDGYGAAPVTDATKQAAQHLVETLPIDIPEPEASPDPDGEVSLTWDFGSHHVFTVSMGASELISYAGILGKGKKRHGEEPFSGDMPKVLVEFIREIAPPR
jgi:hypothetical protein